LPSYISISILYIFLSKDICGYDTPRCLPRIYHRSSEKSRLTVSNSASVKENIL
jgi:hypothetical protein